MSTLSPVQKIPDDIRYVGTLSGCYILASRRKSANGRPQVLACRATSISPKEAVLVAPVAGFEGERLTVNLDQVGILKGYVARLHPDGFAMTIEDTESERQRLAAKVAWLKKRVMRAATDNREYKRSLPHDPRSVILFADDRTLTCFIIDLSKSGVAVSADVMPDVGTPIAVGTLVGHVVRHLDRGFAVAFARVQDGEDLEQRLGIQPAARKTVLAELRGLAMADAKMEGMKMTLP